MVIRSNITDMSKVIQKSMRNLKMSVNKPIKRSKSDVDEISSSVSFGIFVYDNRVHLHVICITDLLSSTRSYHNYSLKWA